MIRTREPLLMGKAQYSWPSCTNMFSWAPFYIANIFYFKKLPFLIPGTGGMIRTSGLYYKSFTIVIYDCNDIGLYYKTRDDRNWRS